MNLVISGKYFLLDQPGKFFVSISLCQRQFLYYIHPFPLLVQFEQPSSCRYACLTYKEKFLQKITLSVPTHEVGPVNRLISVKVDSKDLFIH